MADEAGADRLAVARDDVEDAGREDLRGELAEAQRGQRRELGRLEDDRVARGERRADLPDGHHQRVVPRRDLAHDADRLAPDHARVALHVLARGAALHHACGAGEEAHVVDRDRHLLAGDRHRLADVGGLEAAELLAVLLEQVASLSIACARSPGGVSRQPGNAALAAATARSTSACVPSGTSAMTSPVAGLTTSRTPPSTASTRSPADQVAQRVLGDAHVRTPQVRIGRRPARAGEDEEGREAEPAQQQVRHGVRGHVGEPGARRGARRLADRPAEVRQREGEALGDAQRLRAVGQHRHRRRPQRPDQRRGEDDQRDQRPGAVRPGEQQHQRPCRRRGRSGTGTAARGGRRCGRRAGSRPPRAARRRATRRRSPRR